VGDDVNDTILLMTGTDLLDGNTGRHVDRLLRGLHEKDRS
jgi:hypothetical protein